MKRRRLNIVFLGLSLSSSWGNGHATTYRALIRSLADLGHEVLFLERSVPWYRDHQDLKTPSFCQLEFYSSVAALRKWSSRIASADAVIVGSFVPDGVAVADWVFRIARGKVAFYDIDTPVTLNALSAGKCAYLSTEQIRRYALYLSFTGGPTLRELKQRWGAKRAHVLYCSVDRTIYKPQKLPNRWDLGYLGTYSADRQHGVEDLIIESARNLPNMKFVVAGAQYPRSIHWPRNVERIEHIPPSEHVSFYGSLGWALNITRADMKAAGYSPSVRLFEAAACGAPIISDHWHGIDRIFSPAREIIVARNTSDVVSALQFPKARRDRIAGAARRKILQAHTSDERAMELEDLILARETMSRGRYENSTGADDNGEQLTG